MLHGVLSPSQHGQTMVEKQTSSYLRIITGQWLGARHFRQVVLGILWPQAGKGKLVHPHVEGSESKENGNLFPCINVFHPLLATSGREGWDFGLKGGVTLIPLVSLYGCWGDQWDHVCEVDWLECAHVVQCKLRQQDFFSISLFFSQSSHRPLATCTDCPMSLSSSPSASTLWVIHLWSMCK